MRLLGPYLLAKHHRYSGFYQSVRRFSLYMLIARVSVDVYTHATRM